MEVIDAAFNELAANVGFPADQLKFLFSLFASYPLGFLMKYLPNSPSLKHMYSIVFSALFSWLCLGPFAIFHSVFSSFVAYLMMATLPHGTAHKVVFVWVLGYMSASHIYRMYFDWMGWTMDFTTSQMLLTQKLTSMAFNYFDGNKPAGKATKEQQERAIKQLPGLLEFYGFVFFLPSYMAGPSMEITEYQNYISGAMFNDSVCKGKMPSTLMPALAGFGRALLLAPLLILQPMFPVSYLISDRYLHHTGILEKLLRLWLHCTLCRIKYYFAWYLSEGIFNATGIGYRLDGTKVSWDRFRNVDFFGVELAPNVRSVTTYWNMRTAEWLRHYVYTRVVPEGTKTVPLYATVATYSVSAFWHGFYPGYYTFFLLTAVVTEVAKDVRRSIRPLFINDKNPNKVSQFIYDVITTVTTSLFLNYGGSQFLLLDLWDGVTLMTGLHFFAHVIAIGGLVFFRSGVARLVLPRPAAPAAKKSA
eukprot:TRINITY_DN27123_c0_g1_i1.p1 TRINITY_DN27123_c0_g1~~TRINITY_DN27123_c0_g1_i1.p1  ORF type:complete len:475 (+),score=132.32 TRINITY_DN27123_c0_g1_i1:217-1641(+)